MNSPIVPRTNAEALDFFKARLTRWADNAAAIGVQTQMVSDLAVAVSVVENSSDASDAARADSKAKTILKQDAFRTMREIGGDLVKMIRTYAEATKDINVYDLAWLPEPADPQPAGPPTAVTNITFALGTTGQVTLKWDGTLFARQYFTVRRQIEDASGTIVGGPASWDTIGSTQGKEFIDSTVPFGTVRAFYQVLSHRGTEDPVASNAITVTFGNLTANPPVIDPAHVPVSEAA